MSICVHDIDMFDCVLCLEAAQTRNYVAALERIATLERELAEARKNHQWEMGSRAVCLTEIDKLKRELAAVTAERDALKAGRWAGPVEWRDVKSPPGRGRWGNRRDLSGESVAAGWEFELPALDAALLAAGWYLAPAPPTGTPGDGTR